MAYLTKISEILTVLLLLSISTAMAGESTSEIFQHASSLHRDIYESPGRLLSLNHQNTSPVPAGKKSVSPGLPVRIKTDAIDMNVLLAPLQPGRVSLKKKTKYSGNGHNSTISLSMLEKKYRLSPDARLALTELEMNRSLLEQKQAQSGLKLFAGAGIGSYKTPVTDTLIRDYQRGNIKVGLSYPL
ncbi:MAG: hypothetical protein DSY89_09510, partial [Deltaproteobacteria bacterium]